MIVAMILSGIFGFFFYMIPHRLNKVETHEALAAAGISPSYLIAFLASEAIAFTVLAFFLLTIFAPGSWWQWRPILW